MGFLLPAGLGLAGGPDGNRDGTNVAAGGDGPDGDRTAGAGEQGDLHAAAWALLRDWGEGLLQWRVNDPLLKGVYGGLLCPACAMVHGRSGDAIYPLLLLADRTGDERYLTAALTLYDWMEGAVSCPDGSWTNEINVSDWKGITAFGATALGESLLHFGHLLEAPVKARWMERLHKAGTFIHDTFTIDTGNINYPAAGSYALTLIGGMLGERHFADKGAALAEQALRWITPADHLVYGEGKPPRVASAKGCYSVDLGYNVEETLPSLALLARLKGDKALTEKVVTLLHAHLAFMLPDGAWDNSWGTRNFKWTYWGSRTSDGCQPAYGLMAAHDPVFYRAALKNVQLMQRCTQGHMLYAGLHTAARGIPPCIHLTFSHSKALATLLVKGKAGAPVTDAAPAKRGVAAMNGAAPMNGAANLLPRERAYGIKHFKDIGTWLIAKGDWRATVTGYDQEYLMKGGHATGGALTMLWHSRTGPLITAGMNRYQMVEPFNMQSDRAGSVRCLTPRWEVKYNGKEYTQINDLRAQVTAREEKDGAVVMASATLVDEEQAAPPLQGGQAVRVPGVSAQAGGGAACTVEYRFAGDGVTIHVRCRMAGARYVLPVIAAHDESVEDLGGGRWMVRKGEARVMIVADAVGQGGPGAGVQAGGGLDDPAWRAFNYVPGLEAWSLSWQAEEVTIKISVI